MLMEIMKASSLIYPIMLAQEAGEISESKAAELIGLDIVSYREVKQEAIQSIVGMVRSLPSPLVLLLAGTKAQPSSSMPKG